MPASTRCTSLLSLFAIFALVRSQQCYYPNGNPAVDPDAPCNGAGVCCPLNWQCLSNGLCALPSAGYLMRATCTDRNWSTSLCNDICLYNGTAYGNEAILQCPDGRYCCDTDRQHGNCCEQSAATFFQLAQGSVIASISTVNTAAVLPSSTPASNPARSSSNPVTVANQPSASSSRAQTSSAPVTTTGGSTRPTSVPNTSVVSSASRTSTSLITSVSSVSGRVVTQIITVGPTGAASGGSSSSSSGLGTGAIVGIVVGVVGGLVLIGAIVALLFLRRRRNQQNAVAGGAGKGGDGLADMYANRPKVEEAGYGGTVEADGQGVQPVGNVPGKVELPSDSPRPPTYATAEHPRELAGTQVHRWELEGDVPNKS